MIVWRGLGLLAIVFLVGPLFAAYLVPAGWANAAVAVAYLACAPATWFVGRRLNEGLHYSGAPSHQGLGRILDDGFRDRELRSGTPWHSFMMVKLEYWAFPVALAAAVFAVLQLLDLLS